jgi:hypothetical protein
MTIINASLYILQVFLVIAAMKKKHGLRSLKEYSVAGNVVLPSISSRIL